MKYFASENNNKLLSNNAKTFISIFILMYYFFFCHCVCFCFPPSQISHLIFGIRFIITAHYISNVSLIFNFAVCLFLLMCRRTICEYTQFDSIDIDIYIQTLNEMRSHVLDVQAETKQANDRLNLNMKLVSILLRLRFKMRFLHRSSDCYLISFIFFMLITLKSRTVAQSINCLFIHQIRLQLVFKWDGER